MNILTPASRRLLTLAVLSVGSIAWGQDAPAPTAVPADEPAAAPSSDAAPAAEPAPTSTPSPASLPNTGGPILPLADPNTPLGTTLGGILSGNSTAVGAIQRQDIAGRDKLLAEIAERVQTADSRIAEIQQKNSSLNADVQKGVERALAGYAKAKQSLQQSWENLRGAEANTWERTRGSLATNYAFFVAAAADVEYVAPEA